MTMSETICHRCSHPNSDASNYCSSCGFDLQRDIEEATENHVFDFSALEQSDEITSATLVITRGAAAGSRFELAPGVTTIGRHPESTIFLDDVTVSRRHAEIRRDTAAVTITDAGSLNGTYVNRERAESASLRSSDEVQIGKFKLVFLADEA